MSLHFTGFQKTFTGVFVCSSAAIFLFFSQILKKCPFIQNVSEGSNPCSPGSQTANLQRHIYITFDNIIMLWLVFYDSPLPKVHADV
jgi:hypothetical protein